MHGVEKPRGSGAGNLMRTPASIAFFIRALEGGGASRDAIVLANALADQGHKIALLTLQAEGPLRSLVSPRAEIVAVGAARLRTAAPSLARTLRLLRPDVLVSAEAAPNVVALLATRLLPKTLRPKLVLREASSPSAARAFPVNAANRWGYLAARHVYKRADLIVALTEGAKRDLALNFGVKAAKIAVMSTNAVLTPDIMARLSQQKSLARERGLIACVGRLSPEKDQLTLVRAMALLAREHEVRLVLAGEGPLKPAIAGLIAKEGLSDRVALAGHVDDPYALLQRAELAVCSSIYEGFGNAIVEALACGTPVVSTDCPYGPREILDNGKYGRLVPVGDAAALAEAMAKALADPVDRGALRRRGFLFTADRAAAEFLRIMGSI